MSGPRGTFAAIPFKAHHSPPLAALRAQLGPLHDVYFYRAMLFCKEYLRTGRLRGHWGALASFVNWPDSPEDLAVAFRMSGVVSGDFDLVWEWDEYNGWLLARANAEAKRKRDERRKLAAKSKAGRASGKVRRRRAKKGKAKRGKPFPDPVVVAGQRLAMERVANGKETPER